MIGNELDDSIVYVDGTVSNSFIYVDIGSKVDQGLIMQTKKFLDGFLDFVGTDI
ncbi:hypothetical protein [Peribacillus butanolivorans]|uniref:hypothetical protein n=1 Tax=Peribacillus butanolivorans TaxID=421767 RepID=UPI00364729C6